MLDASTKPLAFNRVPPNLLAGAGASEFAFEQGIPILPANSLVSRGSRERWLRWNHELQLLELQRQEKEWDPAWRASRKPTPIRTPEKRRNTSPASSQRSGRSINSPSNLGHKDYSPSPDGSVKDDPDYEMDMDSSPLHRSVDNMAEDGASDADADAETDPDYTPIASEFNRTFSVSRENSPDIFEYLAHIEGSSVGSPGSETVPVGSEILEPSRRFGDLFMDQDDISDTVGAIAIDCNGNIAAGSSSGGIGMKHSGRTGPAALVGVGTAVVPVDVDDELATSSAAVTSGTGEHMATTMAAGICAERIYASTRKVLGKPGVLEMVTEDEALKAVIEQEFMGVCFPSCCNPLFDMVTSSNSC